MRVLFFKYESVHSFIKSFLSIFWYVYMSLWCFLTVVNYIDWLLRVKLTSHFWNKLCSVIHKFCPFYISLDFFDEILLRSCISVKFISVSWEYWNNWMWQQALDVAIKKLLGVLVSHVTAPDLNPSLFASNPPSRQCPALGFSLALFRLLWAFGNWTS